MKKGSVVRLLSGGPKMTIMSITTHEELAEARCYWYCVDKNIYQTVNFPTFMLILAE